jgi:hypothetical protein
MEGQNNERNSVYEKSKQPINSGVVCDDVGVRANRPSRSAP